MEKFLLAPKAPRAFSPDVMHKVVLNGIDFDLPEHIWDANELYTDESQRPNRHARIEYDYKAYVKGKLERQGKKYIAKELKAGIEIDEDQLTINKYFYEPLPKVTKEELIRYIQDAFDNGIKEKYDDNTIIQFVIEGNKLILMGGNEVNDYFIKLVE